MIVIVFGCNEISKFDISYKICDKNDHVSIFEVICWDMFYTCNILLTHDHVSSR